MSTAEFVLGKKLTDRADVAPPLGLVQRESQIDRCDVDVVERARRARLTEKPRAGVGVTRRLGRQELERHAPTELHVDRAIHHTHAAAGEARLQPRRPDLAAQLDERRLAAHGVGGQRRPAGRTGDVEVGVCDVALGTGQRRHPASLAHPLSVTPGSSTKRSRGCPVRPRSSTGAEMQVPGGDRFEEHRKLPRGAGGGVAPEGRRLGEAQDANTGDV